MLDRLERCVSFSKFTGGDGLLVVLVISKVVEAKEVVNIE